MSSVNLSRRASVSSGSTRSDDASAIAPHTRPWTTIGLATAETTPRRCPSAANGPCAGRPVQLVDARGLSRPVDLSCRHSVLELPSRADHDVEALRHAGKDNAGKVTVELHDECTAAEQAVDFVADGGEDLRRLHALGHQRRHSPQRVAPRGRRMHVSPVTMSSLISSSGGAKGDSGTPLSSAHTESRPGDDTRCRYLDVHTHGLPALAWLCE